MVSYFYCMVIVAKYIMAHTIYEGSHQHLLKKKKKKDAGI